MLSTNIIKKDITITHKLRETFNVKYQNICSRKLYIKAQLLLQRRQKCTRFKSLNN